MYELLRVEPFDSPVLIVAFDGWVNAGSAGTMAASILADEGPVVARFHSDSLFDYRQSRPSLDFVEGVITRVMWPEVVVRHRPLNGRDLLVMSGPEPNWNWQQLSQQSGELAGRLGVVEEISVGGIPWAAPHTRPVTVITTASDRTRLSPDDERPEGLLRVPASAVSVVEHGVAGNGIPTMGYWARVPHYVGTTYFPAAIALVERIALHLGLEVPLSRLHAEAAEQSVQLDAITEARPEVKALVAELEELADTQGVVSGEDLAAEIERYLRQQGDGDS